MFMCSPDWVQQATNVDGQRFRVQHWVLHGCNMLHLGRLEWTSDSGTRIGERGASPRAARGVSPEASDPGDGSLKDDRFCTQRQSAGRRLEATGTVRARQFPMH